MKKLLALSLLSMGCRPMDADMTGHWWVWLSANSSLVVDEGNLPDLETKSTVIECTGRGWDEEAEDWDPTYIGPKTLDEAQEDRFIGGDPSGWCAMNDDGDWDASCADLAIATLEECAGNDTQPGINSAEFYTFLFEDGIYGLQGEIEPQRTDAFINGENDLQISMKQDMGNGEDFRFLVTVAADFNPTQCRSEGDKAVIEEVDGADWIDKWSEDEDGNRIYYLNAGGFQVNESGSSGSNTFWYLITDWSSGFAFANFAGEELYSVPGAYGNYDVDGAGNYGWSFVGSDASFVALTEGERSGAELEVGTTFDELPTELQDSYLGRADRLQDYSATWTNELRQLAGATTGACTDGVCDCADGTCFEQRVETNDWRPLDVNLAGLDGWMEVHSSWVRFSADSKLEVGGSAKGDYQILFRGEITSTLLLVKGTFVVDDIKSDRWAYSMLEEEKRADTDPSHQGQQYCK